jgi:hypothetical protein
MVQFSIFVFLFVAFSLALPLVADIFVHGRDNLLYRVISEARKSPQMSFVTRFAALRDPSPARLFLRELRSLCFSLAVAFLLAVILNVPRSSLIILANDTPKANPVSSEYFSAGPTLCHPDSPCFNFFRTLSPRWIVYLT